MTSLKQHPYNQPPKHLCCGYVVVVFVFKTVLLLQIHILKQKMKQIELKNQKMS